MPSPTSLAPGFVRVTYDGTLFPHHTVIPVKFDGIPTPGSEPNILLKDGSSVPVSTAIAAMFDLIKPFFHTGTNFGNAEVHTVDATTGLDRFIWTWNVGKVGTASGTNFPTVQVVMSFKTSVGSQYKLYMMEPNNAANFRVLPPYANAAILALSDYIVSGSSPVYGRQNAYPLAPVSFITKSNDKLRKQQGLA